MDEYDLIKGSSLKFKGEKTRRKLKPKKTAGEPKTENRVEENERQEDAEHHGGWWKVEKYEQIRGDIAIEFLPGCYAKSLSNGNIVLGNLHPPGEGPEEEEIFTAICPGLNQLALKSGFGRYLNVDSRKCVVGISEAIGEPEIFLTVFEEGKLALCAYNDCFLSPDEDDEAQPIKATATKVGPNEILKIRVNYNPFH